MQTVYQDWFRPCAAAHNPQELQYVDHRLFFSPRFTSLCLDSGLWLVFSKLCCTPPVFNLVRRDRRKNATLSDNGLQLGPLLACYWKHSRMCWGGQMWNTSSTATLKRLAPRQPSSIVLVLFVTNVFLCSYLDCGEMFPLGAGLKHCLQTSLTMLQVTGVSWTLVKIEQQVEMHRHKSVKN